MKHIKLFENFLINESSEDENKNSCTYYNQKKGDEGYKNYWEGYDKLSPEEKNKKLEPIKKMLSENMKSIKKEYNEWYSNPETIKKFSKKEEAVRKSLLSTYLPKIKLKVHTSDKNNPSKTAWGFFSPSSPEIININLFNFFNGKREGNKSTRDTLKHEMAHAIDNYFSKNGVRTYDATHPPAISSEEYSEIYLINDKDQFARLNVLRGIIGAGPADSAEQLLNKFMKSVQEGKITSKSFTFSKAKDPKGEIFFLVMTKKPQNLEKGKNSLEDAEEIYSHMRGKGAVVVDGKENSNIQQLFSNFAKIKGDKIAVNMNDISNLNFASKGMV